MAFGCSSVSKLEDLETLIEPDSLELCERYCSLLTSPLDVQSQLSSGTELDSLRCRGQDWTASAQTCREVTDQVEYCSPVALKELDLRKGFSLDYFGIDQEVRFMSHQLCYQLVHVEARPSCRYCKQKWKRHL